MFKRLFVTVIAGFALGWVLMTAVNGAPESFQSSVANVLVSEGGAAYTNHPADPGGPTRWGVTLKDVRAHIKPDATAEDVKALTRTQAVTIYQEKYWRHPCVRADKLPAGLDYMMFDYGVNAGASRAGLVLRRVLAVNVDRCAVSDGLLAIVATKEPVRMIRALADERRHFYANLIVAKPQLGVFRNGWMNRVDAVERIALKMAGAPVLGLFGEEIEAEPAFGPGKAWVQ